MDCTPSTTGSVVRATAMVAGSINALDRALRAALTPRYPALANVRFVDYRVRVVDEHRGAAARPRVFIEPVWGSIAGAKPWSTVGCSVAVTEASWLALDGLELPLARQAETQEAR
jgi:2-isopropylmalate synthase